ncbi:MAG: penicillin-binding protein activator LpoB [Treponema sp.]|jgi:PBP1b-binding outer membrane lipoprotein LpoB|nr:penicillin-binding protein activator LpoB [Treponema sp.]
MKRVISVCVLLVLAAVVFSACSSTPRVTRVGTDTPIDLSGRWNDHDARTVSSSLIQDSLSAPSITQFIQQFYAQTGRRPAALVGTFRNDSSEHIDTTIISRAMEIAIVNSGQLDFVAGGTTREEIRNERHDQLLFASDETAAALANETGAILLLTGSINSIVDRAGNTTVRSYFVTAEFTNIETNRRLWMGENSEIRKVIRQPARRL